MPGKKVVAFGSRVKGTAKPYSDLDLAIYSQSEIPVATMAFLRDAFESSMLPYKVDVVDVTSIDRTFLKIIQKDQVTIQSGPTSSST